MAASGFGCVDDHRRPFLAAAGHPGNAIPVGGVVVVLMMAGLLVAAAAIVGFDALAIFVGMQLPPIRRRVMQRASRAARQRAAQKLGPAARCEWQGLELMCRQTEAFNLRRGETEALLDSYLNTALALHYATSCLEVVTIDRREVKGKGRETTALAHERERTVARTDQALAVLRAQLERIAQRIRLQCELAVADECEAGAELWGGDLEPASSAVPLLGSGDARTE